MKKKWIAILLPLIAAVLMLLFPLKAPGQEIRPNVLVVVCDDCGHFPMSLLPNTARLAAEGTTFTMASSSFPSCTASRSGLLTGMHPAATGPGANLNGTLNPAQLTFQDALVANGYYAAYMGKGWSPGDPLAGGRTTNPAGLGRPGLPTAVQTAKTKPWSVWDGLLGAHRLYSKHDYTTPIPTGFIPPWFPSTAAVTQDVQDYLYALKLWDAHVGSEVAFLESKGLLNKTVIILVGDNGWPFPGGKADTRLAGVHVPLIIRYPPAFGAGAVRTDLVNLYDLATTILAIAGVAPPSTMQGFDLRVPTGRTALLLGKERHCDSRPNLEGYPARSVFDGRYQLVHNFHPDRTPMGDQVQPVERVCSGGYADMDTGKTKTEILKLSTVTTWVSGKKGTSKVPTYPEARRISFEQRPEWELFDTQADPYETHSIFGTLPVLEALLQQKLQDEMEAVGDPWATLQGGIFDLYPWYN